MSASAQQIDAFLQARMRIAGVGEVGVVEAARWLDEAGLLTDSAAQPGLPPQPAAQRRSARVRRPPRRYGRWFIARQPDSSEDRDRWGVEGYLRHPQTEEELAGIDEAARRMIADEPW
jgi:hypothetical protein